MARPSADDSSASGSSDGRYEAPTREHVDPAAASPCRLLQRDRDVSEHGGSPAGSPVALRSPMDPKSPVDQGRTRQPSGMDDLGGRHGTMSQLGRSFGSVRGSFIQGTALPLRGMIAKQARKWPHKFHKRYYEVIPGQLRYWESEADCRRERKPPLAMWNLEGATYQDEDECTLLLCGIAPVAGKGESQRKDGRIRVRVPRGAEGQQFRLAIEQASSGAADPASVAAASVGQRRAAPSVVDAEHQEAIPLRYMIIIDENDADRPQHASAISYCRVLCQPGDQAAFFAHVHRVGKGAAGTVRSVASAAFNLGLKTRAEMRKELDVIVGDAAAEGARYWVSTDVRVDYSDCSQVVAAAAYAREYSADIVAFSKREKYSRVKSLTNALVVERAVLYCPCQFKGCSVLGSGRMQFLLVYDGSPEAGRAAHALARLARSCDRVLVFVPFSVIEIASGIYSDSKRVQKMEARKHQRAEAVAREGAAIIDDHGRLTKGALDLQVRDVSALRGVRDLLKDEELSVNMVVCGTHLQPNLAADVKAFAKHQLFGDVVDWLMHESPVAYLIVP
eukprot:TRINITY_DN48430_c0_g1_i1.p1 TRINITY_DN48430_c0_g1~~TRINITY_DN48430_c0_g1_i1.p1  ORF type:complete len:562 (+),score=74.07 TRINITY_DN48430_c0_g1_i1:77-1762(+)